MSRCSRGTLGTLQMISALLTIPLALIALFVWRRVVIASEVPSLWRWTLLAIAFVVAVFTAYFQGIDFEMDRCIDAGGRMAPNGACDLGPEASAEYISQFARRGVYLPWAILMFNAYLIAWLVYTVGTSRKVVRWGARQFTADRRP